MVGEPAPEPAELVLRLASILGPGPTDAGAIPVDAATWEALCAAADVHTVAPLLRDRLAEQGIEPPRDVAAKLDRAYHASAARNLGLLAQLRQILQALAGRGLEVLVLKGLHLAGAVYPSLAQRPMFDLDLLAREEDLAGVRDVLLDLGYRMRTAPFVADHQLAPFVREGSAEVDLHRAFTPDRDRFDVDYEAIWARSRPETLGGIEARVLDEGDLLLHLTLHAAYSDHFGRGLGPLCDVDVLVARRALDGGPLGDRARTWRAGRCLELTLTLAHDFLGTPVPDGIRPGEGEEGWARAASIAREQVLGVQELRGAWDRDAFWADRQLHRLGAGASARDRAAAVVEAVFPRPADLPPELRGQRLAYPRRWLGLARTYLPVLLRRGRGGPDLARVQNEGEDDLRAWLAAAS